MNRIDLTDFERIESPRDRVRAWFETAFVFIGLGLIGWFTGDSLRTLLAVGGWVAGATVLGAALVVAAWFWWSAWSRRGKLLGAVLLVLAIVTPFAVHYA